MNGPGACAMSTRRASFCSSRTENPHQGLEQLRIFHALVGLAAILSLAAPLTGHAEAPGNPTAVKQDEDGIWRDKAGDPTFKVDADGTVDWYTYSGYIRYTAECLRCHGPDGEGSSYGPALAGSLKTIGYAEFYGIVVSGKKNVGAANELVMPAFADDKNVMCYLTDIYIYLRGRSVDVIPRGRPAEHAPKPPAFDKNQDKCMSAS
jgi:methanol metabolism-related c-type cytochrome